MARPRPAPASARRRCAIYTRKSTEEGLEQAFNSLDAQREACAAYILSQRHEGWSLVPDLYDDGGFSGGTMERPALKALLAEVAAGRVDVIVVYKVDRLTRSLADFAKIVEILDARDASFVSVTQAFNTTTSMGRLTLNVLLSFAQFEREVTGERIRDKIAASKAKGMWMGGIVPLGYAVEDRKLVIRDAEADQVRDIFHRYLVLGSARSLQAELDRLGIRSRKGATISRGGLYAMLQNRLYIGEVVHKGTAYPGQHQAIVDAALFEAVQRQLAEGTVGNNPSSNTAACSLLAGLLVDAHGRTMSPSHTTKAGRRYRYYVSQTDGAAGHPAWRIGAHEIERVVCDAIVAALDARLRQRLDRGDLANDAITQLRTATEGAKHTLTDIIGTARRDLLAGIVRRIDIAEDSVAIDCNWACIDPSLGEASDLVTAPLPLGCVRTRKQQRMLIAADDERSADPATVRLIARAFAARKALLEQPSIAAAASSLGYSRDYIIALARLSYLAPDLITGIVDGSISGVTSNGPLTRVLLPSDWNEQRAMLAPV